MISSGRSFTVVSSALRSSSVSSQSFEPAAHAGVDAQRAGLQHDAADQVGIDACASPRPVRPDACSIWPTIARASSSDSSYGGRQLDGERAAPRAPSVARTPRRSPRHLPAAALLRRAGRRKLRNSVVGVAGDVVERPAPSRAGSSCGLRRTARRAPASASIAVAKSPAPRAPCASSPLSFAASNSARAYDAVRDRSRQASSRSSTEKSSERDRLVDQPALVASASSTLPVDLRGGASSVRSATSARICVERARGLARRSASACPRAAAGGRPRSPRGRAARSVSRVRRASARISSASDCACADQRAVLLEQLRAPPRARGRPPRATRGSARGARRSPSGSGRTRSASGRRARSGSRRSSRSSAPGVTWISGFDARASSRRGRTPGSSRAGRRTRPPR